MTPRQTLLLLTAFAATLTASGFILEYGFGVLPCQMCWWQRYAHWAIFALSLLGLTLPAKRASLCLVPLCLVSLTGLSLAVWQFAAQHGWLPFPASCTSSAAQALSSAQDLLANLNRVKIVPCDKETFKILGLSLASWNIPAMLAMIAAAVYTLKNPK